MVHWEWGEKQGGNAPRGSIEHGLGPGKTIVSSQHRVTLTPPPPPPIVVVVGGGGGAKPSPGAKRAADWKRLLVIPP